MLLRNCLTNLAKLLRSHQFIKEDTVLLIYERLLRLIKFIELIEELF
jgi:hypothetical protein